MNGTDLFGDPLEARRAAVKKRLGAISTPLPGARYRILSLGGGLQSSVLCLMSARGDLERLDFAIFADTGWEKQATYDYLDWLEQQCPFPIIRARRPGPDLGEYVLESVGLPVTGRQHPPFYTRMPDGTIGMWPKQCSKEFKTRVVQAEIRRLLGIGYGERGPGAPIVEQWLGMSTDELRRISTAEKRYIHHRYPLIEDGRRMSRADCIPWLEQRQLRIPPKSSCIFCPLQRGRQWRDLKVERRAPFPANEWICDSGSFTKILTNGGYPRSPEDYAAAVVRVSTNGRMLAAVTEDFMCEAHMLEMTRARPVAERMLRRGWLRRVDQNVLIWIHQRWTIKRFDRIRRALPREIYLMPVLQGYEPRQYRRHIRMYGSRLEQGMWVGVGSVCKRNGEPEAIEEVLLAVKRARPDLSLHGFGVKTTALGSGLVQELLYTADSMAWSFAARKQGRDANCMGEAAAFARKIEGLPVQHSLIGRMVGIGG